MSEVGFEPTPTIVDQNAPLLERVLPLESGALDRSAILTHRVGQLCSIRLWFALIWGIICENENGQIEVEDPGIDPGTSRMLSERSTI